MVWGPEAARLALPLRAACQALLRELPTRRFPRAAAVQHRQDRRPRREPVIFLQLQQMETRKGIPGEGSVT